MYLPEEHRVEPGVLHRAGAWLHAQLRDVDQEFVEENFCPCSHSYLSGCAVQTVDVRKRMKTDNAGIATEGFD